LLTHAPLPLGVLVPEPWPITPPLPAGQVSEAA
jgi:hypothetical protein